MNTNMNAGSKRDYTWPAGKYGTLLNVDPDVLAYFSNSHQWDYSDLEEKLERWFDRYLNCGITDLIFDIEDNTPYLEREWNGSRFLLKEERGNPVDYSGNVQMKASYLIYTKHGLDPFSMWFRRAWENTIRPWISFRMNDVHYAYAPVGHTEFFYRAKENGWMIGDTTSKDDMYEYALNYAVPEVREHFLEAIEKLTQKYDAFGIELDYHRTIRCFPDDNPGNQAYMTDFMRRVREICRKAEQKWGHPWRVMIRLSQSVARAELYGFDVKTYIKEGLADAFVPSGYWGSTDNAIPIHDWKAICPKDIPVFWGLELHTVNMRHWNTIASIAGYMLTADASGADGLYQYNTFNVPQFWKICSAEAAYREPVRRFLTTMNDIQVPHWKEYEPKYLPLKVSDGAPATHVMTVGKLKNEDTLLFVGIKSECGNTPDEAAEHLRVFCNGTECVPLGKTGKSFLEHDYAEIYEEEKNRRYPWRIFTYRVPAGQASEIQDTAELTFVSDEAGAVCYVELANGMFD